MRVVSPLFLVVMLAWVAPAATQSPALPQPPEPFVAFLVNEATGAAMPLEAVVTKPERSGGSYFSYVPGASSPVAVPSGAPLRFVIKVGGLKDPPKFENWRGLNKLERLAVGKNDRRYATKEFIPMDVAPYGEVTTTLDKKNKTLYWMTLVYTPRQPLPPGEYAFSALGLIEPAGFAPRGGQAFRVAR